MREGYAARRPEGLIGVWLCATLGGACLPDVVLAPQDAAMDASAKADHTALPDAPEASAATDLGTDRGTDDTDSSTDTGSGPDDAPDAATSSDLGPPEDAAADVAAPPDVVVAPDLPATDTGPACPAGQSVCNGACVDTGRDARHCGGCGMACAIAQGQPACSGGGCRVGSCNTGFADCDGNAANGCEVDIRSNARHCGRCDNLCNFPGAGAVCAAGVCQRTTCETGRGDCDGNAGNGCETTLATSTQHCGACGNPCTLANATPSCQGGACRVGLCATGFGDCDGNAANGCEVDTRTSLAHCGACGRGCAAPANGEATCGAGACGFRCRPGFVVQGQACVSAPAPRPIWPSNHAYVTARRPRLRWALSAGAEGAEVEYCADRDCTRSLYRASATGTETTAPSPLPPGVVYWRLRGVAGGGAGTAVSPTWQMTVPPRDAPTVTHWGINFDVNGDGRTDLAVGDFNNSRVYVYLGTPSGLASSPAVTIQGLAGSGFGDGISAAGDLDGDGFGDLLIGVPRERRVYIWRGARSTLSSSPQATIDGGTAFGSTLMGVGDFNGDGFPDAVLGSQQSLVLHLGNGTGLSTTGIALSDAASHGGTALGDFNGDRLADFATLVDNGRSLAVFYGVASPGGGLSPTSRNPLGNEFGSLRSVGDIDGDGRSDLAGSGSSQYRLFPAGSVTTAFTRARTSAFAAVGVDAEADGYFDLFGLASNQSAMPVYRARSSGLDTTARDITLDRSRVWLYAPYAGDFNGDGYGDVAAVTFSSPGLILVSHGGPGGFGSTPTQSITLPFSGTASFF